MTKGPIDLASARILVTNDDGIHAPGLKVLERVARSLSRDVWTVAPEVEQSGASHALTTLRPLRIRQFGPRRYAIDGTPTDCVLVALHRVVTDRPPDQVTGIRACHQGRRQSSVEIIDGEDPHGRPYVWIGDFSSHHSEHAESDLRAVADGAISVTPLHLDMTHRATLENLPVLLTLETAGGELRP